MLYIHVSKIQNKSKLIGTWFFSEIIFITFSATIWAIFGNTVFYNVRFTLFTVFITFWIFCFAWTGQSTTAWTHCIFRIVFRMAIFHWRELRIIIRVWKSLYVIIVTIVVITVRNVGHRFARFLERGFNGGLYLIIFTKVYDAMFLKKEETEDLHTSPKCIFIPSDHPTPSRLKWSKVDKFTISILHKQSDLYKQEPLLNILKLIRNRVI